MVIEPAPKPSVYLPGPPVRGDSDAGLLGRRTCAKLIRFREGELAAVTLRATECGRPVACYIREAALGVAVHARRTPVNDALIRELARLGNELAMMGRQARDAQLSVAPEFERGLDALLTLIRSIE